jgi:glutamate synthase domain-containing protein 3
MHACEYMTGGTVVILGATGVNVGAGMTGGVLVLARDQVSNVNHTFIQSVPFDDEDDERLRSIVTEYYAEVSSKTAAAILSSWGRFAEKLVKFIPVRKSREMKLQDIVQQTTSVGAISRIQ